MRVLRPHDAIYAFYEGRIADCGAADAPPNWVNDGALSLGIASYAIVSGHQAIVYDTHVSVDRARSIRAFLEREGVRKFVVVLSHWHLDHVAGNAAFEDCEIISSERTAALLTRFKPAIEQGTLEGPPRIEPLVLPTLVFADRLQLRVGDVDVRLIHTNIHSDDATVLWLPGTKLLLCGDTLEDPITYVAEPNSLHAHLENLETLRELGADYILPNHGHPDVIGATRYGQKLISETAQYIKILERCRTEPRLCEGSLRELIATTLDSEAIHYFAPYETVHRNNVKAVLEADGGESD